MILLLKTHVQGYTRKDGVYVGPHQDKRKPAQIELFERKPTGGDQVIVLPYASGMSRRRDMGAAVESAAGLGTVINEISRPGMGTIADAIAAGKPVFVDSGAFPAFRAAMKAGKPEEALLDFDKVFARYDELSALVQERAPQNTSLLMMVAPDVVGDQAATLELLETHKEKIKDWIWAGHEVIVPMQRGAVKQYDVFLRVKAMLDDLPFVVGIPSAAAALSNADLRELLSHNYKPDRIHILGAVSSKAMQERMGVIRDAYKDDVPGVTADANIMRSKLHELYGLKGQEKIDAIKKILNRVTPAIYGGNLAKGGQFFELTKARAAGAPPSEGDRIEFTSDRHTDKGPATGTVAGVKMTVDGYYVTVKFSDAQESFSWDDIRDGATKSGDLWMIKADYAARYQRMLARRTGGDPAAMAADDAKFTAMAESAGPPTRKKFPIVKTTPWKSLFLDIENPAGSVRSGKKPDGSAWQTTMAHDYGEIRGTEGVDGDAVDVFVGPDLDAPMVYVVHQNTVDQWDKYDEDKCMVGFGSLEAAKAAFLSNYDDKRFLGPITELTVGDFINKVRATADKPAMIKSVLFMRKARIAS